MSAIRFYLDEHIWLAVGGALHKQGIDCLTTQSAGRRGARDEDNLTWCLLNNRVIVTSDADYAGLHAQGESHAGIAFVGRGKFTLGALIERFVRLGEERDTEDMAGWLEYL